MPGNKRRHMASTGEGFPLLCRWVQVGFSKVAVRLRFVLGKAASVEQCGRGTGHKRWEGISILGGFQNWERLVTKPGLVLLLVLL